MSTCPLAALSSIVSFSPATSDSIGAITAEQASLLLSTSDAFEYWTNVRRLEHSGQIAMAIFEDLFEKDEASIATRIAVESLAKRGLENSEIQGEILKMGLDAEPVLVEWVAANKLDAAGRAIVEHLLNVLHLRSPGPLANRVHYRAISLLASLRTIESIKILQRISLWKIRKTDASLASCFLEAR